MKDRSLSDGTIPRQSPLRALIELTPPSFLGNAPYGIFVLDADLRLAHASSFFFRSLGDEHRELSGRALASFSPALTIPSGEETAHSEVLWKRKDGTEISVDVHLTRQFVSGEPFFLGLFRERGEHEKYQEEFDRLSRVNLLLSRANGLMADAQEELTLLSRLCDHFVDHGSLPLAFIGKPDEEGWIHPLAASGETGFFDGLPLSVKNTLPEGQSIVGLVFRTGRPRFISTLQDFTHAVALPAWKERIQKTGFQSAVFFPVKRGGETWGILCLCSREKKAFSPPLPSALESLMNNLSRALDRLDLISREKDVSAFQQALLDNTVSGVLLLEERTILKINEHMIRMLGYDRPGEFLGQSVRMLYDREEDFQRIDQTLYTRLPQEKTILLNDLKMRRKNGAPLWVDSSATLARIGDRTIVVGVFQDVTERHQQAERLQRLSDFNLLLARSSSFLSETDNEQTLFQGICNLAVQSADLTLVRISRPDSDGWLRTLAAAGETEPLNNLFVSVRSDLPQGTGPGGDTWRDGIPRFNIDLLQSSIGKDPARESLIRRWGIRSSAFLTVRRGGATWALLTVHHTREEAFDKALCGILQEMAKNLGRALDRLDLNRRDQEYSSIQKALLDNTVSGIMMSRDKKLVSANRRLAEIFGYGNPEEMVGMESRALYQDDEEYAWVGGILDPTIQQKRIVKISGVRAKRKNGLPIIVDISTTHAGEPESRTEIVTFEDATDRHEQAERLRRISTYNTFLSQTRQAMANIEEESALLREICRVSVRKGGFSLAWIGRPHSDGWFTVLAAESEKSLNPTIAASANPSIPEGQGPAGRCWRFDRIETAGTMDELFPHLEQSARLCPDEVFHNGLKSGAALPIHRDGALWAVLGVYDKNPHSFREDVLPFLGELAHDLSVSLDRIDLKRREKEISSLQDVLLANTVSGIMLAENRKLIYVNKRLVDMFGYESPDEMIGRDSRFLYATLEEYLRTGSLLYPAIFQGSHVSVSDIRAVKKDGTPVWIDLSCSELKRNGNPTLVATLTDVTDRHLQQEQLVRLSRFTVLLADVRRIVATAQEESQLLKTLCEMAVTQGELDIAWIGSPDEKGWFRFSSVSGHASWIEGLRLSIRETDPEGRGAAGNAWKSKLPWFNVAPDRIEDTSIPPSWKKALTHGIRSTAALPLFRGKELVALFCFLDRRENAFDSELQKILVELAQSISEGLDRIDLLKREEQLATLNQAIIDNALAGFILTDSENNSLIHVNPLQQQELGYTDSLNLAGLAFRALLADDQEMDRIRRICAEKNETAGIRIPDVRLRHQSGLILYFDLFGRRLSLAENDRFLWTTVNVTERNRLQARIEHEATHDLLTGLPNRRGLEHHLGQAIARSRRAGTSLALGLLDLDDFKPVNDNHGHEAGDRLLKEFALRSRKLLRETDLLARLGGDEFVVVMEGLDHIDTGDPERSLFSALDRLHRSIEAPFSVVTGRNVSMSMSMGIALFPEDGATPDALLRSADQAMYQVKFRKENRTFWWQRVHYPD